jgi:3-phosphoshikimate 1-carboxyvinyltransferase
VGTVSVHEVGSEGLDLRRYSIIDAEKGFRKTGIPSLFHIFSVDMSSMILSISPVPHFTYSGRLPGNPAVAQTAITRAALSNGRSTIGNLPDGEPGIALLLDALSRLGCRIEHAGATVTIEPPSNGLREPDGEIGLADAAYPLRLLIGLLAAQPFRSRLTAGHPLNKRNIERVLQPLREIGAELTSSDRGTPPVFVFPATLRTGSIVDLPIPNAWVKAALVTAARAARIELTITEPVPSRDYSERLFEADIADGTPYSVRIPSSTLSPIDWTLPSDSVLADHLTGLAMLRPGSPLAIEGRLTTPLDRRLLRHLRSLGATYELCAEDESLAAMPAGRLTLRPGALSGTLAIDAREQPGIESELPLLAVLIGCGGGSLEVHGAMNMRQQLCDRISAVVDNLAFFGIDTEEYDDGFRVTSTGSVHGDVDLSAYDDPVIAAAMILLCALADRPSLLFDVPDDPRIRELISLMGEAVTPRAPEEIESRLGAE